MSGHALINIESFAALGFLVLLFARSRSGISFGRDEQPGRYAAVFVALCFVIAIAYWSTLGAPFVYDDYTHITDARHSTWRTILAAFGPMGQNGQLVFRPFGFVVYWLTYRIAGESPTLWHTASMVVHAVNGCLFFALCRSLRLSWLGSTGAAFLFTLNAASVESVAWIDARFDPSSTILVLVSLLCVVRFLDTDRKVWIVAACIAGASGIYTKESAFCLPLLAACLWFFRPEDAGRLRIACLSLGSVAAVLFVYRWWVLGGVGGYPNQFHPIQVLNGFLIRDWTILFFPVNWSQPPSAPLRLFLYSLPIALGACVWWARVPRRVLLGCIALTTFAAVPVQHLLLIGTDLANTRVLYLLSVGWAILWGAVITSIPRKAWQATAIAWLLVWHALMLRHNLAFWLRVPEEARSVCTAFAQTALGEKQAVVSGLPQRKDGVVFLANGFPECVEMNGNLPASRVNVSGEANFAWNEKTGSIEPVAQK
jgi:hypothetical protein